MTIRPSAGFMCAALVLGAVTAGSAKTKPASCPGRTTPEVNECLFVDYDKSKTTLLSYLNAARQRIMSSFPPQILTNFDASQTAWMLYRDAECDAVTDSWKPGTASPGMDLTCLRRLTEDRTHEIWHDWLTYVDQTPPVLPEPLIHPGKL